MDEVQNSGRPARRQPSRRGVLQAGLAAGRSGTFPRLPTRDANAHAPLDMIDLRRPSFSEPPPLAQPLTQPLTDTDQGALTCGVTGPGTIPPPGSITGPGHS
jgi:hypothetical protein